MSTTRGRNETEKLKEQVEDQLNRLLIQLQDLEEEKDEFTKEEYNEIKELTISQLRNFQESLERMAKGNMTLVDQFGAIQLAIQAAVSSAFKTPEVISMFAKKDLGSLRQHLTSLQTSAKLGKISKEKYTQQAVEILTALKKLGEKITPEEENFLQENRTKAMAEFESAQTEIGQSARQNILSSAANANKQAQT